MKKINFLLLFVLLIFIGCQSEADKREEERTKASELISQIKLKESKKGNITDPVFLDIKLGMSEKEYNDVLAKMYKEGKLSLNEQDHYTYTFNIPDRFIKSEAEMSPYFYENKLLK